MPRQITNHIMMIKPANFGFNEQTAESNAFQSNETSMTAVEIQERAVEEFDTFVKILRSKGVHVEVVQDSTDPNKPDAIFPNNWISFHEDGSVITYPMQAPIRRLERREDVIKQLEEKFKVNKRYSFEVYEEDSMFLEGTGSMILDRANQIVYACLSPRTDIRLLDKFSVLRSFRKESFFAKDQSGKEIYHTNVMMALGEGFCVICLDCISEEVDRKRVQKTLKNSGKEIIEISFKQMNAFAGNMLSLKGEGGHPLVVMSQQAKNSLNEKQLEALSNHAEIVASDIETIEKFGGGSVRCMMAEVFLPLKMS